MFGSDSSAANSIITNFAGGSPTLGVFFQDHSTTGTAEVETLGGGATMFSDFSTGGTAQFNTDTGGTVDFSGSEGPAGDNKLTAGSIAGAGTYHLGANQLTVLSGNVSGLIDGLGGALVKAGKGTLTLSGAGNTYSGGTILEQGTLELDAIGAAGPGAITFASIGKTKATLEIDNAALSAHHFGNSTDNFGKHDFVDLTGLRFHAGATATYHKANHNLTVHSGSATDTLTLLSPHGTHFAAASDHHGGTDVFLFFA